MERYLDHFREEHIEILQSKVLFRGMNRDEIRSFIVHANPVYVELYEGQRMRLDREFSHMIGLVITGVTHIYSVGYDGTRTLLRSLGDGETSGLLCSMLDYQNSLVEFVASSDASKRTVRDKVMRFLYYYAERVRCYEFTVPFSREELADYLAVDRASLSRTLGELKKEGVIDFNRSRFRILSTRLFKY